MTNTQPHWPRFLELSYQGAKIIGIIFSGFGLLGVAFAGSSIGLGGLLWLAACAVPTFVSKNWFDILERRRLLIAICLLGLTGTIFSVPTGESIWMTVVLIAVFASPIVLFLLVSWGRRGVDDLDSDKGSGSN